MAASWQQNLAVLVGHRRQGMAWIGSAAVCRAAGELARWAVRCRRPDGVGSGGRDPLGLCMGLALQPRRCDRSGLGCCGLASWQRWSLPGGMQLPTNHGFVPEDLEDAGASAPLESEADRTWPHRPAPRVHAQEHPAVRDSPVGTPTPVWSGPSSKQRYRSIATGRLASAAVSPDARSCMLCRDGSVGQASLWVEAGVVGFAGSLAQPRVKGSRVPPLSSTQTDFVSRYSSIAAMPFSRPRPEAL
jgi:hypothetical protein